MLAGKLKLACSPAGALASASIGLTAHRSHAGYSGSNIDDLEAAGALQQLLQLEGMTPRRAAALRAVQINSCAELVNAPVYDIFKVSSCSSL